MRTIHKLILFSFVILSLASPAHAAGFFVDDDGHIFEEDIERLAAAGVTSGCDVDRFCVDANVTRGQMAAFLHRALDGELSPSADPTEFSDLGDSEFAGDIEWLSSTGVTKGCGEGTFCPDAPVSRGEMAAFLVRALRLTETDGTSFTDDDGSVFEADIEKLATAGITQGCGDQRFCPDDDVTRGEMAAFLVRAGFGADLPNGSSGSAQYDAAKLAQVKNGLSGMWVSRKNPGIHWLVVDHLGLNSDNFTLFGIDSYNDKLVWRGEFDRSGSGGAIETWADVEDLTGVERDGDWFLAIWDNGKDAVYELREPTVTPGQSLESQRGLRPDRIVEPNGGQVGSGNIEAMAWSATEDAMYWIGPRGSSNDLDDNPKDVLRVNGWSGSGSSPTASTVGQVIGRPEGTNVPNAVGAMDISSDGNTMVVMGVGSGGGKENAYAMIHTNTTGGTWAAYFDVPRQASASESILAGAPSEDAAFDPDGTFVYTAGEGNPGSDWSAVFRYALP